MLGRLNDIDGDVPPRIRFNILGKLVNSMERIVWSSHQTHRQYRFVIIICFANLWIVLHAPYSGRLAERGAPRGIAFERPVGEEIGI